MTYYSYEHFVDDVKSLVKKSIVFQPDVLIAVARGGWTLGHAYASATDNRRLMSINSILYEGDKRGEKIEIFNIPDIGSARKALILDDIVDSGETMHEVLKHLQRRYPDTTFKVASLFYKKTAKIIPDYTLHEAHDWIEFFWEKDYKNSSSRSTV